jgi:SPW repeat
MKIRAIQKIENTKWENWVNLFMGAWVFLTPWILADGFKMEAVNARMWNFVMIGSIVMISSKLAINRILAWAEWLGLCAAVWLFFSPWFLLYNHDKLLTVHSQICGFVIAVLFGLTIPAVDKYTKTRFHKHKASSDNYLLKH